jgi:hypothetical protein
VPPDGTHDARQPHPPTGCELTDRQGIGSQNAYTGGPEPIRITLDPPGSGAADLGCWELCETGIEGVDTAEGCPALSANEIRHVAEIAPGTYELYLVRPISAGYWTTIEYLGGAGSHVTYASLPGDATGDGYVQFYDLNWMFGMCPTEPPPACFPYCCDIDRSGLFEGDPYPDIYRAFDLMGGAGKYYGWSWLPPNTTCPDGGSGMMASSGGGGPASADLNETLIWGFVDFVTTAVLPDAEAEKHFRSFAPLGATLLASRLSKEDREWLADVLLDPKLAFEIEAARESVPDIVNVLLGP